MRYLLILIAGAGIASLYWLHFTGHEDEGRGVLSAAVLTTVIALIVVVTLAFEEDKL